MTDPSTGFSLHSGNQEALILRLTGDWVQEREPVNFGTLDAELAQTPAPQLTVDGSDLGKWDSILMAFLLHCHNYCAREGMGFSTRHLPASAAKLLEVATSVPPLQHDSQQNSPTSFNPMRWFDGFIEGLQESLAFIGEVSIALFQIVRGKANTRFSDFRHFCYQAGPDAFGIISLTSVLVGMILAYLGAVQLRQFGAEIYVADLVAIGMLREMGVLMTAVVMAGRTGAAYAAQLGTMQTNEEIDAITTMGISPMEFLVIPRLLALVAVMPLLTIYADLLGIIGGGIVAGGMGITPLQYINEARAAIGIEHIVVGLIKSVVFGALIAMAGCRAGINSGRSSAAVGKAATEAVVTAIIYLIVADAAINIVFQQMGI